MWTVTEVVYVTDAHRTEHRDGSNRAVDGSNRGREVVAVRPKRSVATVLVVALVLLAGCSGGGGGGGGDGGAGSADWCDKGDSYSYSNPQSGEEASMEIKGIVDHNGRQVCKAVWTGSGGSDSQVGKMELYFTENGDYNHLIMYDEDGNKLYEIETTPSG